MSIFNTQSYGHLDGLPAENDKLIQSQRIWRVVMSEGSRAHGETRYSASLTLSALWYCSASSDVRTYPEDYILASPPVFNSCLPDTKSNSLSVLSWMARAKPSSEDVDSTRSPPLRRSRAALACEQCRSRKVRCDGAQPSTLSKCEVMDLD